MGPLSGPTPQCVKAQLVLSVVSELWASPVPLWEGSVASGTGVSVAPWLAESVVPNASAIVCLAEVSGVCSAMTVE